MVKVRTTYTNRIVACYPDHELHVISDLNIHKPKHDQWLACHPKVYFHYTSTHGSWLNQIECWFSILWRQALQELSASSPKTVCRRIDTLIGAKPRGRNKLIHIVLGQVEDCDLRLVCNLDS
jgi:hypothetical protein